MKYSIITTCKGRLQHLQNSLPRFMAQADSEVIVVDYDCPQNTRGYVMDHFPQAKLVEIDNKPKFHLTHARNCGAAVAEGEFLVFVDADIIISPDFTQRLELTEDQFGIFMFDNDARGSCVLSRKAFEEIGQYDEVVFGYSQEDLEIYMRLELAGKTGVALANDMIAEIQRHTNQERVVFGDMGRKLSYVRGKLYRDAKRYLLLFSRAKELPYDTRLALWQKINEALAAPNLFEAEHCLEIPLPVTKAKAYLPNCEFGGSLRLTMTLKK